MIREKFNELIELIYKKTKEYYKENLTSFVVFGSCSRNLPTPESDIDLLIILKKAPTGRIKRVEEFYLNIEKPLENYINDLRKYGINTYISPIIRTEEEVKIGSPLYIDMLTGVKILWDEGNFFSKYLSELKEKLEKLGAEKREGYWIYKKNVDKNEGVEV
ncbi:MAG: hypothetical protein CBR30_06265 [Dictyoglomus sp. NZ13-RE01]|nr:MAG: hypothetical protein CBR30_06265 [Dictyoglomus sp. NZ13-RE01]